MIYLYTYFNIFVFINGVVGKLFHDKKGKMLLLELCPNFRARVTILRALFILCK